MQNFTKFFRRVLTKNEKETQSLSLSQYLILSNSNSRQTNRAKKFKSKLTTGHESEQGRQSLNRHMLSRKNISVKKTEKIIFS